MKQTTQQRLREALSARNMLPIELSRLSGIGKSAISQYLSGKVTPKQDKIYKLAQALKVNESWLMGYDEPMEQSPPITSVDSIPQTAPDPASILLDDEEIRTLARNGLENLPPEQQEKKKAQFKKIMSVVFDEDDDE